MNKMYLQYTDYKNFEDEVKLRFHMFINEEDYTYDKTCDYYQTFILRLFYEN